MNSKKDARLKRAKRTRMHIKRLGVEKGISRMTIHRTPRHIYAQILSNVGGKVLAQASSLELRSNSDVTGKVDQAKAVGELLAKRAQKNGVQQVACDRSGFKYHGRLAALVDSVREAGIVV